MDRMERTAHSPASTLRRICSRRAFSVCCSSSDSPRENSSSASRIFSRCRLSSSRPLPVSRTRICPLILRIRRADDQPRLLHPPQRDADGGGFQVGAAHELQLGQIILLRQMKQQMAEPVLHTDPLAFRAHMVMKQAGQIVHQHHDGHFLGRRPPGRLHGTAWNPLHSLVYKLIDSVRGFGALSSPSAGICLLLWQKGFIGIDCLLKAKLLSALG